MSQTTSVLVNVTDTLCTRMLVVDFDRGFLGSVEREIAEPYTEGSPHNLAWIKAAFEPGQEHRVFKTASDLSIPVQLIEELRRLESKGELGHAGELQYYMINYCPTRLCCYGTSQLFSGRRTGSSRLTRSDNITAGSRGWYYGEWAADHSVQCSRE